MAVFHVVEHVAANLAALVDLCRGCRRRGRLLFGLRLSLWRLRLCLDRLRLRHACSQENYGRNQDHRHAFHACLQWGVSWNRHRQHDRRPSCGMKTGTLNEIDLMLPENSVTTTVILRVKPTERQPHGT